MTLPAFHLWHAACERADGEVVCRFDVTAPEIAGLARGDAGVMPAFADALHLEGARVRSWRVVRFCTPYYGHEPEADDWRDRVELAWRAEVRLAGDSPLFDYGGLGPVAATARDPSYDYEDFWMGGVERSVVIADDPGDGDLASLGEIAPAAAVQILEYRVPDRVLRQARIDLGMLDLPRDEATIRSVVEACAARGASTHWFQTSQRAGWRESRLPTRAG